MKYLDFAMSIIVELSQGDVPAVGNWKRITDNLIKQYKMMNMLNCKKWVTPGYELFANRSFLWGVFAICYMFFIYTSHNYVDPSAPGPLACLQYYLPRDYCVRGRTVQFCTSLGRLAVRRTNNDEN